MVSYVLMITIVVVMAVLVYAYLELSTPKRTPPCDEERLLEVNLRNTACVVLPSDKTVSGKREIELNVTLDNRGKRSVSGVYLRLGPPHIKVRTLMNANDTFFGVVPESPQLDQLAPGYTARKTLIISEDAQVAQITGKLTPDELKSQGLVLEVEPFLGKPGSTSLCERAIIAQPLPCPLQEGP